MKLTVIAATVVTTAGFLIGELVPELAVKAFTSDATLVDMGARGMRIVVMFFPIIGFQMVTSNFFSEHRNGKEGHHPFAQPSGDDPDTLSGDTSFVLGS